MVAMIDVEAAPARQLGSNLAEALDPRTKSRIGLHFGLELPARLRWLRPEVGRDMYGAGLAPRAPAQVTLVAAPLTFGARPPAPAWLPLGQRLVFRVASFLSLAYEEENGHLLPAQSAAHGAYAPPSLTCSDWRRWT